MKRPSVSRRASSHGAKAIGKMATGSASRAPLPLHLPALLSEVAQLNRGAELWVYV